MRFTKTYSENEASGEAIGLFDGVATFTSGHTVDRSVTWKRTGGWQYEFACSCGWRGTRSGAGTEHTNAVANRHEQDVFTGDPLCVECQNLEGHTFHWAYAHGRRDVRFHEFQGTS